MEETYGEDPDYYDGFFVPPRSRWAFLHQKLNDAGEPFGSVLDKALGGLSETNESLEHVLDHISFMRTQGNKRVISDEACKDLVRHFSRQRLRNEDFQFSDLLGAAYEFLINMFAESAGKKGGDFYTPRDVIRLMARLLKQQPKMSIYDPTCGSGGMLIISREFVEQAGGDPSNLRLCGQVNDASAWSICRLNMLLHGVRGADIRLQDTLLHPLHLDGEVLERFDRVIANPPFSQNYTRSDMEFPERFQWGWCPTTGKKGDLMFAQHMLHVCKPDGMVATVMPHGVLFRGGAEKEIRRKFLAQDLVEAVIGLPPNLFYGAGIPACILVMRPNYRPHLRNSGKPDTRRGKVLFINADAEFHAGRAQNYLRPEHIEKIASTFDRYEDVPGYARVVEIAEIADPLNDWNLNIRRYVDNAPPPEPHDVRAHLHGGVPIEEIEAKQAVFEAIGLAPERLFRKRPKDKAYRDFPAAPFARTDLRPLVENDPGVAGKSATVTAAFDGWWAAHAKRLATLPARRDLNAVRGGFLASFNTALEPTGALDHFKLAGVIATWWTDSIPDFKTLLENGFRGVLEGWVDTVADALEDDEAAGPAFDPFAHKLVLATMGDYLERIAATKREIARLKGEKEAFEQSNAPDDLEEEELAAWNYPKDLERQRKELKADHREALAEMAKKNKAASLINATANQKKTAEAARKALRPVLDALQAIDESLAPYGEIKDQLAAARAEYRKLLGEFVHELKSRCDDLKDAACQALVLPLISGDMRTALDAALAAKRQELVRFLEGLWDKYAVTLGILRRGRKSLEDELTSITESLAFPKQFKASPLGRIPRAWEVRRLSEMCVHLGSGLTPRGGQDVYTTKGVMLIRSQNVHFDGLRLDDVAFISESIHLGMLRSEVFPHDVLFNITGASIGRCCAMPDGLGSANVNQHVCILRLPDADRSSAACLAAILSSSIGQRQLDALNTVGNRQGLNFQQLGSFQIPWPDAAEERTAIHSFLATHDRLIAAEQTELTKLRQLKSGLMTDLLEGRVRVPEGV